MQSPRSVFVVATAYAALMISFACGTTSETVGDDAGAGSDAPAPSNQVSDATKTLDATGEGRDAGRDVAADDAEGDAEGDAAVDASIDAADAHDSAPLSDPGRLACGGAMCKTDAYEQCCVPPGGSGDGGSAEGTCTTSAAMCLPRTQCDERADCWSGSVCCGGPTSAASKWVFDSVCLPASSQVCELNGGIQMCKTDAECDGAPCTEKTCAGRVFFSCGALPAWMTCL